MFGLYLGSFLKHVNNAKCFVVCLLGLALAFQDYFSHPEPRQAVAREKTDDHKNTQKTTTSDHQLTEYGLFGMYISERRTH